MKNFFTTGISVFLGFTFWGSGMAKLYAEHQFFGWIGPPWLVERLAEYQLGLFAEFIAICQIIIGYLLLTTRFKLLGGIMMVPMIVNILMVTISQNWTGTPYVLAVLLGMNGFLLWQYRDFFRPLLDESFPKSSPRTNSNRSLRGHLVWCAGLGLNLLSIPVSFERLHLAFGLVGLGLILSFLAFRVDRYLVGKNEVPND